MTTDSRAFENLVQPYRPELLAHCYRMLGSYHDAEDALQDTMLGAWQGLARFEERASLRTWLYRIATHRCLNALRSARRRPQPWNVPGMDPPEPTQWGEVAWLEPFPDAKYERTESMSLAFITALQRLPPRQVAVVVLRDVLGFSAKETAALLEVTVEAANGALKRARTSLKTVIEPEAPPRASEAETQLVERFVSAYEAADLDAVVALLTDDVFMAMPPIANEYRGSEAVRGFLVALFGARKFHLAPTRANGQPAFGLYIEREGVKIGTGLMVLGLSGDRISSLLRFERDMLGVFGLPS